MREKYDHELKTWTPYFKQSATGQKPFELRYNDRGFKPGETLLLREYCNDTKVYTGEALSGRILSVVRLNSFVKTVKDKNWVILGLGPLTLVESKDPIEIRTDNMHQIQTSDNQLWGIAYSPPVEPKVGMSVLIKDYCSDLEVRAVCTSAERLKTDQGTIHSFAWVIGFKKV